MSVVDRGRHVPVAGQCATNRVCFDFGCDILWEWAGAPGVADHHGATDQVADELGTSLVRIEHYRAVDRVRRAAVIIGVTDHDEVARTGHGQCAADSGAAHSDERRPVRRDRPLTVEFPMKSAPPCSATMAPRTVALMMQVLLPFVLTDPRMSPVNVVAQPTDCGGDSVSSPAGR